MWCFVLFVLFSVSVAFTVTINGMAGIGKSSVAQALCQESKPYISHSGEGTLSLQIYNECIANWTVIDTPGYGTRNFPNYVHEYGNITIDLYILCIGNRVYTQDLHCFNSLPFNSHVVILRTRCDIFPCITNQLMLLHRTFPGANVFGISTLKEHERFKELTNMVTFVEDSKILQE